MVRAFASNHACFNAAACSGSSATEGADWTGTSSSCLTGSDSPSTWVGRGASWLMGKDSARAVARPSSSSSELAEVAWAILLMELALID